MRLDRYTQGSYTPGAPLWQQALWYLLGQPLLQNYWLPYSPLKATLLRCFGAQIGTAVTIKSGVRVKFPWRLSVGDWSWLGERAWLDNLATVTIERHVSVSQGAYLCTGNHDWRDPHFRLITAPITLREGSWIAACAVVGPGVTVERGAVLGLGSVAAQSLAPMTVYQGNPAQPVRERRVAAEGDSAS